MWNSGFAMRAKNRLSQVVKDSLIQMTTILARPFDLDPLTFALLDSDHFDAAFFFLRAAFSNLVFLA
jgi:hypothetical protein